MLYRTLLGTLALGLVLSAHAQSLSEYLKVRASHGIQRAVGMETLNAFVGKRVLEVSGQIKGTIVFGDEGTLMLETVDGTPIPIRTGILPEWMLGQSIRVRMVLEASREHESASLQASLKAAVPEDMILAHDAKNKPAAKPSTKPTTTTRKPSLPSRSSTPRPMPGRVKDASAWSLSAQEALPHYVDFILGYNKKLSRTKATQIAEGVISFSLHYGVDARLVMALLIAESGFNPKVTSHAGAMGLGQLMPGTARELGVSNAYDTTQNLYGTVKLLSRHIGTYTNKTGDDFEGLVLALAAYNAGPGAVRRHGGVPPYRETQNYVRKVISLYRQLCGESG